MAKTCKHNWVLRTMGAKTYVTCANCSDRFPVDQSADGSPYKGPVPERYQNG